jgi:hypothetical protein
MTARVTPELPDAGERMAKVTLVDRIIDPASNTFRVRLELPNPGNDLPAGLRCKVAIGDQVIAAPSATPSSTIVPSRLSPPPSTAKPAMPAPQVKAAPAPQVRSVPAPALVAKVAPASAMPQKLPTAKAAQPFGDVLTALETWRKAWQAKDVNAYLSAYVPDYRGDKANRADWVKQREARILKPGPLKIDISETRVHPLSDRKVQVHFQQKYQSAGHAAENAKTVLLVLENGKWLIQEEIAGI